MNIEEGLTFVRGMEMGEVLIMLGLAVAVLLFGYRIKKIAFFIIWFLLGYLLVQYLMPTINHLVPEIAENGIYQTLLPFGGGAIMTLLGFSVEKVCVGGICFLLVMLFTITTFGTEMQTLVFGAIAGVVAAGAGVMLMKPAIIVVTAAAGAYAITLGIFALTEGIDIAVFYWPMLIGMTAAGGLFQYFTTKRVS